MKPDFLLRFKNSNLRNEYAREIQRKRTDSRSDSLLLIIALGVVCILTFIINLVGSGATEHKDFFNRPVLIAMSVLTYVFCIILLIILVKKAIPRNKRLLEVFLFVGLAAQRMMSLYLNFELELRDDESTAVWFVMFGLLVCHNTSTVWILHISIESVRYFAFSREFLESTASVLKFVLANFAVILVLYCFEKAQRSEFLLNYIHENERWSANMIFERIPDGLLILDGNLETQYINPVFRQVVREDKFDEEPISKSVLIESLKKIENIKIRQEKGFVGSTAQVTPSKSIRGLTPKFGLSPTKSSRLQVFSDSILEVKAYSNLFEILLNQVLPEAKELDTAEIAQAGLQERAGQFMIIEGSMKNEHDEFFCTLEITIFLTVFKCRTCVVLMVKDVTKRDIVTKLEEKDTFRGEVLSSISHELRTPLNGSIGLTQCALDDPDIPENCKKNYLIPALNSSKLLLSMVNNIIDYTELKSNAFMLDFRLEEIKKTLLETIDMVKNQTERKKIELKFDYDEEIPKTFCTDHKRLSQVLVQLLTNAIKFTFTGSITLSAKKTPFGLRFCVADTGIGMEEHQVMDLELSLRRLSMHNRLNENSTGCSLGLHLANEIAKRLGSLVNGGIIIQSEFQKGSRFYFTVEEKAHKDTFSFHNIDVGTVNNTNSSYIRYTDIDCYTYSRTLTRNGSRDGTSIGVQKAPHKVSPFRNRASREIEKEDLHPRTLDFTSVLKSESEIAEDTAKPLGLPATTSIKSNKNIFKFKRRYSQDSRRCQCRPILIVDDDPFNTLALEQLLLQFKLTADIAFNGQEAINKYTERMKSRCGVNCKNYRLVLMDFNMPVMGGLEATHEIRRLNATEKKPTSVIGCTAYGLSTKTKAVEAGMNECYQKPLKKEDIEEILTKYFFRIK